MGESPAVITHTRGSLCDGNCARESKEGSMESINASQMRYPLRDHKEESRSLQHAELQLENAKALPVASWGLGPGTNWFGLLASSLFSSLFISAFQVICHNMPEQRPRRQEESNVCVRGFRSYLCTDPSLVGLQGCPPGPRNLPAGTVCY